MGRREEALRQAQERHARWVKRHLDDEPLGPDEDMGEDYNLHTVDVDANADELFAGYPGPVVRR